MAVIGDRCTSALLAALGSVVWYCPERFDAPSLFASLLDPTRGGSWLLHLPNASFANRAYLVDSGILETTLTPQGELNVLG